MLMVLVVFGHFSVCLTNSTHAIIYYIHDTMLGSMQMKSSTLTLSVYFLCACHSLC